MDGRHSLKRDWVTSVVYLAAQDRRFRAALLEDPKSAIFARCAIQIPDSFEIRFIERPPEVDILFVLPHFVGRRDHQASVEIEALGLLPVSKEWGDSMGELDANSVRKTDRTNGRGIELSEDELEHVVGGLQRTWIDPRTGSDNGPSVERSEGTTPAGTPR